jgi:hypothetical protein
LASFLSTRIIRFYFFWKKEAGAALEIREQRRPLPGLNGYSLFRFPTGSRIDASGIEQLNRKTGKSRKDYFFGIQLGEYHILA